MNFATLKGLSIPVPQIVIPETNDIYYSVDAELNRITSGETYIVTVDGVKYECVAFNYTSAWGDYYTALGDTRIETDEDGVPDNSHPEDVPFLVQHVIEDDGFGLNFISKYWLIRADEGDHTIKIEELTDKAVTQITDASGNVLWKQAPSGATVKITTPDSGNASFPNIIIDGVNYNNTSIEYELVVPIGTIVEVGGYYLNGTYVSGDYTIMGDVEIQRYTHVTPPSPPTSFSPTVTVRINIIEL